MTEVLLDIFTLKSKQEPSFILLLRVEVRVNVRMKVELRLDVRLDVR